MIGAPRATVKRLRTRVRAAVKANPRLRAEKKRAPSPWRLNRGWEHLRVVVPFGVFVAAACGLPADRLLGLGMLWALCVTFTRATQIGASLAAPEALWIPYMLPIDNKEWLRGRRAAILRSSCWLALDWLAVAAGYAVSGHSWLWLVVAPVVAWAQWAAALGLAVWAVRWMPGAPFALGASVGWIAIIAANQLYESTAQRMLVAPLFAALKWATPGGWLSEAAREAARGDGAGWAVLLTVGFAATLTLATGWRALCGQFSFERVFGYGEADGADAAALPRNESEAPDQLAEAVLEPSSPEPISAERRDELRRRLSGALSRTPGWELFSQGWLERWLMRALTARQRVLMDFLRVSPPWRWSRGWMLTLAGVVLAKLLRLGGADEGVSGCVVAGALVFFALPVFGGTWQAFDGLAVFQARIGLQSFAPVGFAEAAGVMLRVNAVRVLFALPLVWAGVQFGFTAAPLPWLRALNLAAQASAFVLMVQPIWVIAAFSKSTNDTSARWWFTLLMALGLGGALIGAVLGGVMIAAAIDEGAVWIGIVVLLVLSHAMLLAYGIAYRCGVFDLVNVRRDPGT